MKVAIHFVLGLFVLAIAGASSCKPEPDTQKYLGTYPLGDIKDYLYFKPGSYWVYECDSTGELDTQLMVSIDTPWIKETFIQYQELDRVIQSKNEGSKYSDTRIKAGISYSTTFKYYWYTSRWSSNPKTGNSGTDCIFFKPFDTNTLGGFGSSPTNYKGLLTNYSVLGKTYDTVRVFQVQYGAAFAEPKIGTTQTGQCTYYWAKKVGLIRLHVWTAKKDQTTFKFNWNLKSYQLK